MQENTIPVTTIPFPAVTICPSLNMDIDDFDYEADALKCHLGIHQPKSTKYFSIS